MNSNQLFRFLAVILAVAAVQYQKCSAQERLRFERTTIVQGDETWDWTQARTAFADVKPPFWLTTMSRTAKVGAHGFHDVYLSLSRDRGESWTNPTGIPSLQRTKQADGYEVVAGDLWPKWHAATSKILLTGKTFNFEDGTRENIHREQISYAVIDPKSLECGPLRVVVMPQRDHHDKPIIAPNSGCHQRVDLPSGEILLPIRYQTSQRKRIYRTIVAWCAFDGETLTYLEHGTDHSIPTGRGLYEPSLTEFRDEFYLTMRADDGAYVSKSSDGIHYRDQIPWKFDDGKLLGSEHTQQHWATLGGRLYLIYTRHGANNDHIMRHRAPLFIAEVDPQQLQVIRATEQILVPENHATLGNSGVCQISDNEIWVTVAEGRVSFGKRAGGNNHVILAKIKTATTSEK